MLRKWSLMAVVLVAVSGLSAACSEDKVEEVVESAASAKTVDGVVRITVSERAFERLGIKSTAVASAPPTAAQRTISSAVPYSAVMYTSTGETFVYTSTEPRVFVHVPIAVVQIGGATAFLSQGPPVGTNVVTVGAPELYGVESGLGDENPE